MLNVVTGCLKLLKAAKGSKKLLKVAVLAGQIKYVSNFEHHAQQTRKIIILFVNSTYKWHIKYKTFWHIHILSCLHYLALLKISIRMAHEHRSYSNQVERARSPLFCIVSLIFLQLNFLITKYYVLHITYICYFIPLHSSIHHNNPNQFNVKYQRPKIAAKSHLNIN